MRRFLLAAAAAAALAAPAAAQSFEFVAMGDMPYRLPEDYGRVDRLIDAINAVKPAFTIHVGDIKSGSTQCSDEIFQKALDQLQRLAGALIYTPGDNEWTDCHRQNNGAFDPLERLAKIRQMFFPKQAMSLGQAPIALTRQPDIMPQHATYVENARWSHSGVLFAVAHVVGSNNNFETRSKAAADEYFARDAANVAWIDAAFAAAKAEGAKAVVLAWQADLRDIKATYPGAPLPLASGFVNTIAAVERGARGFDGQVLAINGDTHEFEVMRFTNVAGKGVPRVLRLQVPGAAEVAAVRVTVDLADPAVFGFRPLAAKGNGAW